MILEILKENVEKILDIESNQYYSVLIEDENFWQRKLANDIEPPVCFIDPVKMKITDRVNAMNKVERMVSCVVAFYHKNENNHEIDRRYEDKKISYSTMIEHTASFLRYLSEDERISKDQSIRSETYKRWDQFASNLDGMEMIIDFKLDEQYINPC